jgi:hypothetical protein
LYVGLGPVAEAFGHVAFGDEFLDLFEVVVEAFGLPVVALGVGFDEVFIEGFFRTVMRTLFGVVVSMVTPCCWWTRLVTRLSLKKNEGYCEGHPHTPGKGTVSLCTPSLGTHHTSDAAVIFVWKGK